MRTLRFFFVICTGMLWLPAFGQVTGADSGGGCAGCHRQVTLTQPGTLMARAMQLPGSNPTLEALPRLSVRKGAYLYTVQTRAHQSIYSVTDGAATITLPIRWGLGGDAQTWVLEKDGKYYESLVSYYPSMKGLDTTPGDERLVPGDLTQAMGRELTPGDTRFCFGCHSTHAITNGTLDLQGLKPGVRCEHCHAGTEIHRADAEKGFFDTVPRPLKDMSSEDMSTFCGQCHRTWETVVRNGWRGEANVRFQPYRLANSKCFSGSDARISCIACHNPHQDIVRGSAAYDPACLACHAASAAVMATGHAKSCPVAKANCVSCHMPKVQLSGGHLTFTDHHIRIVRAGDAYPN